MEKRVRNDSDNIMEKTNEQRRARGGPRNVSRRAGRATRKADG